MAQFDNCPNLTTLITGDYPLYIDERAFENCDALATVRIGKGCQSIGWGTFRSSDGPMVVTFAEGSAPSRASARMPSPPAPDS